MTPLRNNWFGSNDYQKGLHELMDWVAKFLDKNKCMTASEEGLNMLITQVLSLVKHLLKFGHYSNIDKINKLKKPLLNFLDGRNDLPYPMKYPQHNPDVEHFRKSGRLEQNQQNSIIIKAKCQAIDAVDLLLNFFFNMRLEEFLSEFKTLHIQANSSQVTQPSALMRLLRADFNLATDKGVARPALDLLERLFREIKDLDSLKGILMDLATYEYDEMVTKTMSLLRRYFSMHETLFTRAVQAEIVITDSSFEVYTELQKLVPEFRKLSTSRLDSSEANKTIDILNKLINFACFESEVEPHPMNQTIIYNYGVLTNVYDILSQKVDLQLADKYKGFVKVVQRCCKCLQVMAKNNSVVQGRLFDRLEMLLSVEGAHEEMALALTEVFTGNKTNCLRVEGKHIQKMVANAAKHGKRAPQLFTLLKAVVKVEEMDLPLKRNQDYVMKYFTQYRPQFASVMDCGTPDRLSILQSAEQKTITYLVSIIDLMAACSEGENKFIESICQSVVGSEEILSVLSNNKLDRVIKRAYVRFLDWVYQKTGGETIETELLSSDSRIWNFLESICEDVEEVTNFARNNKVDTQMILRRRHDESPALHLQNMHDSIHYLIDAVIPYLQTYFTTQYPLVRSELPVGHKNVVKRLAKGFIIFGNEILSEVTKPSEQKLILGCIYSIVQHSNQPVEAVDRLQNKYGNRPPGRMKSYNQKKYEEYYQQELNLNQQFNLFANNFSLVFGGINTVEAQIGYPSQQEYTEVGEDEDLPLGPEFQAYINCFIDDTAKTIEQRYFRASKLQQQLAISARTQHKNEDMRLAQQQLDIKCMQVLRGIIHNETVKLPPDWESDTGSFAKHKKHLKKIEDMQNALDGYGGTPKIVVHLNSGVSDDIIKEALAVLSKLLYGGNKQVQESILEYFRSTREERFFVTIKDRMQIASLAVKERRTLVAQHQAIVQDALDQIKMVKNKFLKGEVSIKDLSTEMGSTILNVQKSMKRVQGDSSLIAPGSHISLAQSTVSLLPTAGSRASLIRKQDKSGRSVNKTVNRQLSHMMAVVEEGDLEALGDKGIDIENIDEKALEERLFSLSLREQDDLSQGQSYMTLMLRVMGYMCDGQNAGHQNYMREQSDNFLSCDLVAETVNFLGFMYGNINGNNVEMVKESLQSLVEFVSGNYQNQVVVFDNKICDYLDFMIQGSQFMGCSELEILEVKKTMGNLIKAMTEENPQTEAQLNVPKVMMENLDAKSIVAIIKESYNKSKNSKLSKEARNMSLTVAFQYYHILSRMLELHQDGKKVQKRVCGLAEDQAMWRDLDGKTMSVEIMKDGQIHKMFFPVLYKSSLREEVKDKFNYEVDRTASERIHDFMLWYQDIQRDVFYTRKITDNVLNFFVLMWYPANIAMILLSFLYMVLISVVWWAPNNTSTANTTDTCSGSGFVDYTRPELRYDIPVIVFWFLTFVHLVLTGIVFIAYIIINKPKLPAMPEFLQRCLRRVRSKETEDSGKTKPGAGFLTTSFFSAGTLWYLSLLLMSIMGIYPLSYGYFLAYHMLHVAQFNQLINRAIQSVTKNGLSLVMIFIFGLVFIFIFAEVNFAFYRDLFDNCETGLYCRTMYECFITVLHRGIIMSLFEGVPPRDDASFTTNVHKAVTDLLFFMLISVVGLDIIFGTVVDTFAELRDNKWQAERDMKASCFICGIDSHLFEKKPGGFDHHVKRDHCQWAYVFLFMHLVETKSNDYTALELYVSRCLDEENLSFFPNMRALSLEHEVDEKEERIKYLEAKVSFLVDKIREKEEKEQIAQEKRKFVEWKAKNMASGSQTKPPAETPAADKTPTKPAADKTPTKPAADKTPTKPAADKTPTKPAADKTPTKPAADKTPTKPAADKKKK